LSGKEPVGVDAFLIGFIWQFVLLISAPRLARAKINRARFCPITSQFCERLPQLPRYVFTRKPGFSATWSVAICVPTTYRIAVANHCCSRTQRTDSAADDQKIDAASDPNRNRIRYGEHAHTERRLWVPSEVLVMGFRHQHPHWQGWSSTNQVPTTADSKLAPTPAAPAPTTPTPRAIPNILR
jgi:hypothetical protein